MLFVLAMHLIMVAAVSSTSLSGTFPSNLCSVRCAPSIRISRWQARVFRDTNPLPNRRRRNSKSKPENVELVTCKCCPPSRRKFMQKSAISGSIVALSIAWWLSLGRDGSRSIVLDPSKSFAWCMANRMASYEDAVKMEKERLFSQLFESGTSLSTSSSSVEMRHFSAYKRMISFPSAASSLSMISSSSSSLSPGDSNVFYPPSPVADPASSGATPSSRASATVSSQPTTTTTTATHKILEIGVGPGPNMELYSRASGKSGLNDIIEVTGLDANVNMEPYACKAAQLSGVPFLFVLGDAEKLPFPDESFEAVVGTHVMCSIPHPGRALQEIARVLKPGGRYLFWEHVRAQDDRKGLQFQQDLLDPLQQVVT
mmetsp:Transcript_8011/g.11009  ORF Transcript_8011/g.11009 Transcript_8011/m.11009 type:complete len:371 (-) Transcript_8011:590-1702(-)